MKEIKICLSEDNYEELKGYANGSNVKVNEFVLGLVYDFLRFQNSEMNEVYLNDDGVSWFSY